MCSYFTGQWNKNTCSFLSKEEDMFVSFQWPNSNMALEAMPRLSALKLLVTSNRIFPRRVENALVKPLQKTLGLELVFPSFRPVSNLPFISKLTEKAPVNPLSDHMNKVRSLPSSQSAYRPFHSTDTSLLKVQSDILLRMDGQKVTLIAMPDLSADTIDNRPIYWRVMSYLSHLMRPLNQNCQYGINA